MCRSTFSAADARVVCATLGYDNPDPKVHLFEETHQIIFSRCMSKRFTNPHILAEEADQETLYNLFNVLMHQQTWWFILFVKQCSKLLTISHTQKHKHYRMPVIMIIKNSILGIVLMIWMSVFSAMKAVHWKWCREHWSLSVKIRLVCIPLLILLFNVGCWWGRKLGHCCCSTGISG